MSQRSNSDTEKSISREESNSDHSDKDEYGSDDFDFVSSSEVTKEEASGALLGSSNSEKREKNAIAHSHRSSSNTSRNSNLKTSSTKGSKNEESNDDAYESEKFESMSFSTASKKDSKQRKASYAESSKHSRTHDDDTSVASRKTTSAERKSSEERSENRKSSLSSRSRHSAVHESYSSRTDSTASSSKDSKQVHHLVENNTKKSTSLSSDDSARKEKKEIQRHQESSVPERSSRSSTPKSFSSSSSSWDSRASHSPAAKRSASSSRSVSPKRNENEASGSKGKRGMQKKRKSTHRSRHARSEKSKIGRGRKSKSRRKAEGNRESGIRNADELQAAPRVSSSHSSQSSRERSHGHRTHRKDGSASRPFHVPENQEELDAMQHDNERMKNELFRIHRERLYEENQRKRREINEAKEGGSTLSRREQFCQVVQAMIVDDNNFRLFRSEEKSLLQEKEEVLAAIRKYRQGLRYKSLLERSRALLEQATEEHHDLSLEVRCNEKLLLMNANVMETGEGALRLREEIRSQNALAHRELQHCVRDLVETEKQKTIVEEEVRQLHEEIERLQSEKKSEKHIDMKNERNELDKLKKEKVALQKSLESLKAEKNVEKRGLGKLRDADPISLLKKGHRTSATQRHRRSYTKEKKAEKEYLESRIRAMRAELEQQGESHPNGGSLSLSKLSSPHTSFFSTDHHGTSPSSSLSPPLHPLAAGQNGYTEDGGLAGHEARLAAGVRKTSSQFKNLSPQSPPLSVSQPRPSPTSSAVPPEIPSGSSSSSTPWMFETNKVAPLLAHSELDGKGKNGTTPIAASVGEQRKEEKKEEDPPDWLKEQPGEGEERSSKFPGHGSSPHKDAKGEQEDSHSVLEGQGDDKGGDRSTSSSKNNSRSSVLDKLLSDGFDSGLKDEEKKENNSGHDEDKRNGKSDDSYNRHSSEDEADSRVGKGQNDDTLNFLDDEGEKDKKEEPSADKGREVEEEANTPESPASSEDEYQDSAFEDEEDDHEKTSSTHTPTLDEIFQGAPDPQSSSGSKANEKEVNDEKKEEADGSPDWLDF